MSPQLFLLFMKASLISNSSVQPPLKTLRVLAKSYEPFMYQDSDRKFFAGVEFTLINTIADELQLNVEYISNRGEKDLFSHNADIITTGVVPYYDRLRGVERYDASIPYLQDDFTWCLRNAEKRPIYLNYFQMAPPIVWILTVIFGLYFPGTLFYLAIEFDDAHKQRRHRDWHFYIIFVTLAAITGSSPRFNPNRWPFRMGYFMMLILPLPIHVLIGTFLHNFMKFQFPGYQVSTAHEIIGLRYDMVGSTDVLNIIQQISMYPNETIQSFRVRDADESLKYIRHFGDDDLAVGGSRQHILNCPEYTPSKVYCFKEKKHIASYQPALIMKKTFHLKPKIDKMLRRLFEAGFVVKWLRDSQRRRKYEVNYIAPLEMQLIHLYFGLFFVLGIGYCVSISTFIAELIVSFKAKQQNRHRFWPLLEQFFSGHRYYLIDWPRRLQELKEKESI